MPTTTSPEIIAAFVGAILGAILGALFTLLVGAYERHVLASAEKTKVDEEIRRRYEYALSTIILDITSNMTIIRTNQLLYEYAVKHLSDHRPYRSYPGLFLIRKDLVKDCINPTLSQQWFAHTLRLETLNIVTEEYNENAKEIFNELKKLQFANSEINDDIIGQAFHSLVVSINKFQPILESTLLMLIESYAEVNIYKNHIHDMIEDKQTFKGRLREYIVGISIRRISIQELRDYSVKKNEFKKEYGKAVEYYNNEIIKAVKLS